MNQDFLAKMSNGDKAIAGGSIIVLVALFLPWYGWDVAGFSGSVDGFNSWGILTFIALLGVVFFWLLTTLLAEAVQLPKMSVTDAQIYMIGGGVEALGALVFWLAYKNEVIGYLNVGVRYGTFVALVGGVVTAYGGYVKQTEPTAAPPAGTSSALPPPPPPLPPTV